MKSRICRVVLIFSIIVVVCCALGREQQPRFLQFQKQETPRRAELELKQQRQSRDSGMVKEFDNVASYHAKEYHDLIAKQYLAILKIPDRVEESSQSVEGSRDYAVDSEMGDAAPIHASKIFRPPAIKPSTKPSSVPSLPTKSPISMSTAKPTRSPTQATVPPTRRVTTKPSAKRHAPSMSPTRKNTAVPTIPPIPATTRPTKLATVNPIFMPLKPTQSPSRGSSLVPTSSPNQISTQPTRHDTNNPTPNPIPLTLAPSGVRTGGPTVAPIPSTSRPTMLSTSQPTVPPVPPTQAPFGVNTARPSIAPVPPTLAPSVVKPNWLITGASGSCDAKCASVGMYCAATGYWPKTTQAMSDILGQLNISAASLNLYNYGNANYGNAMPYLESNFCFFSQLDGDCSEGWHGQRFCPCLFAPPTIQPTYLPTARPSSQPTAPTAFPTSSPTDGDSGLALPPFVSDLSPIPTGISFNVSVWKSGNSAGTNEILIVGGQSHRSWLYFNATLRYPYVFQFQERTSFDSGNQFNFGWHYLADNIGLFSSQLIFRPSGMVIAQLGGLSIFYAGTSESIPIKSTVVMPATLQYGTKTFAGSFSQYGNFTELSWAQNCSHIMIAVRGNIDPMLMLPLQLSYLIVQGTNARGEHLNSVRTTRHPSHSNWVNENNGFANSTDIFIQANSNSNNQGGVEIAVAKHIILANNVVTASFFLTFIGKQSASTEWVSSSSWSFAVDIVDCGRLAVSNPGANWIADGNPSDFGSAFSAVRVAAVTQQANYRKWSVVVANETSSMIYLGHDKVAMTNAPLYTMVNPSSTIPFNPLGVVALILASPSATQEYGTVVKNFKMFGSRAVAPEAILSFAQCQLPSIIGSKQQLIPRWFTMTTYEPRSFLPSPIDRRLGMCPLFSAMESLYKHTINVDAQMTVWSGVGGGLNTGDSGIFVPDYHAYVGYVNSHETSHYTGCVGGSCDYGSNIWMWEGQASFYGQQIRNQVLGLPFFTWRHTLYLPKTFVPGGTDDGPLSSYSGRGLPYTKGELFLFVLAEIVGYETLHSVISNNFGRLVTQLGFIKSIEIASGKNLSRVLPGWLVAGNYDQSFAPTCSYANSFDADGDGLADFQEIIRGTNRHNGDTDGDGLSDYWEFAHGFNPVSAASPAAGTVKDWVVDGIPGDYPYTPDTGFTYSQFAGGSDAVSNIRCKRLASDRVTCAVTLSPSNTNGDITSDSQPWAYSSYIWISCTTAPYNFYNLLAKPTGLGSVAYQYVGGSNDGPQPLSVAEIPISSVGTWGQTNYGTEFILTVPGNNLNLDFVMNQWAFRIVVP